MTVSFTPSQWQFACESSLCFARISYTMKRLVISQSDRINWVFIENISKFQSLLINNVLWFIFYLYSRLSLVLQGSAFYQTSAFKNPLSRASIQKSVSRNIWGKTVSIKFIFWQKTSPFFKPIFQWEFALNRLFFPLFTTYFNFSGILSTLKTFSTSMQPKSFGLWDKQFRFLRNYRAEILRSSKEP